MIVGVPREIKAGEGRVGVTPAGAAALVSDGHDVVVEHQAGMAAGFGDDTYLAAGARVASTPEAVHAEADLIVKVKEPQPSEWPLYRPGQIIFGYFHLAAEPEAAGALLEAGVTAVAYESVEDAPGRRVLLVPMSEIAGKLAVQAGAYHLEAPHGGRGVLLGGVPGTRAGRVVVAGGGVVGTAAARVAAGMGADVIVLDTSLVRLRELADILPANVRTVFADASNVADAVAGADLLVGAVLVPGARAPRVVTRGMVASMGTGAVVVDVAVDQGGCVETVRPTSHGSPTFVEEGVVHYGVANMPGAVPWTSTRALTSATLPYVRVLAGLGLGEAASRDAGLAAGVNLHRGHVTNAAVAGALGRAFVAYDAAG